MSHWVLMGCRDPFRWASEEQSGRSIHRAGSSDLMRTCGVSSTRNTAKPLPLWAWRRKARQQCYWSLVRTEAADAGLAHRSCSLGDTALPGREGAAAWSPVQPRKGQRMNLTGEVGKSKMENNQHNVCESACYPNL